LDRPAHQKHLADLAVSVVLAAFYQKFLKVFLQAAELRYEAHQQLVLVEALDLRNR
jgi:hypothetical protein